LLESPLISRPVLPFLNQFRLACVAILVTLALAACGEDEPDREFAPEISGDQVIQTPTPFPTPTSRPLNRQPGESGADPGNVEQQIAQTGPATSVAYGLREVTVLSVDSGESSATGVPRTGVAVSDLAPDGSMLLTIDRSNGDLRVVARDGSGKEIATWRAGQGAT
jgi:hypothetical protein